MLAIVMQFRQRWKTCLTQIGVKTYDTFLHSSFNALVSRNDISSMIVLLTVDVVVTWQGRLPVRRVPARLVFAPYEYRYEQRVNK